MSISILLILYSWKGQNERVSVLWFHYLALFIQKNNFEIHKGQMMIPKLAPVAIFEEAKCFFFFTWTHFILSIAPVYQAINKNRERIHIGLRVTAGNEMLHSRRKFSVRVGNCCHYQENRNELYSRPTEQDPKNGQFLEMITALKGYLQVRLFHLLLSESPSVAPEETQSPSCLLK